MRPANGWFCGVGMALPPPSPYEVAEDRPIVDLIEEWLPFGHWCWYGSCFAAGAGAMAVGAGMAGSLAAAGGCGTAAAASAAFSGVKLGI